MWRAQSILRKREAKTGAYHSRAKHCGFGASGIWVSSHIEWQPLCNVLGRTMERHSLAYNCDEQHAIASHYHNRADFGAGKWSACCAHPS